LGLRGTRQQGSGKNYIMSRLIICTPHSLLWGDKIEKNEMGETCSTYGGEERFIQGFGVET
jgi:hypothetical protein